MKKTLLILTALLIISAVPVFSEASVSGEFAYGFNTSGDVYESVFDTGDLIFTGTMGAASIVFGLDFTLIDSSGEFLSSDFIGDTYLSVDIMESLGLDSPVGMTFLAGITSFSPQNYFDDMMGYEAIDVINAETKTSSYMAVGFTFLDNLHFDVAIDPDLVDGVQNLFTNAYGSFGIVDAEVYYNKSGDGSSSDWSDGNFEALGANIAADFGTYVDGIDSLLLGAGGEYNIDFEELFYGVTGGVEISSLFFGASFAQKINLEEDPEDSYGATQMGLGFDARYALTKSLKVYGAFMMKDLQNVETDTLGYEISASYDFGDSLTAYAGYVTEGSGYNALGDVLDDSFFFAISTSF